MGQYLDVLTDQEQNYLADSVAYITVLIASADGEIDSNETEWAEKVTKYRTFTNPELLNDFYILVGQNYKSKVKELINSLPDTAEGRVNKMGGYLAETNAIFAKLDNIFAYNLYNSFKSFAKHVAKASGGFLGFLTIDGTERKLIELDMIDPIELILEEE